MRSYVGIKHISIVCGVLSKFSRKIFAVGARRKVVLVPNRSTDVNSTESINISRSSAEKNRQAYVSGKPLRRDFKSWASKWGQAGSPPLLGTLSRLRKGAGVCLARSKVGQRLALSMLLDLSTIVDIWKARRSRGGVVYNCGHCLTLIPSGRLSTIVDILLLFGRNGVSVYNCGQAVHHA